MTAPLSRPQIRPLVPLIIPGLLLASVTLLAMMLGTLAGVDRATTHLITRLPGWLTPFFTTIANAGSVTFLIMVGVVVAATEALDKRWVRAGAMLGSLLALPGFYLVKQIVRRARPVSDFVTAHGLHDYSFPSGHSTGSAAVYGMAAIIIMGRVPARHRWAVWAGAGLLVFLIGVSRVYLGAHFPTDVLGGWLLALVFVSALRTITLLFAKHTPAPDTPTKPLDDTTEAELI